MTEHGRKDHVQGRGLQSLRARIDEVEGQQAYALCTRGMAWTFPSGYAKPNAWSTCPP